MSYVTDIKISTSRKDETHYETAGFTKIDVNLNTGAGGNNTFLWLKRGERAQAITRVQVTFNEKMAVALKDASYTKIERNLNEGTTGVPIYMWYSRRTGPYDVPVTDFDVTTNAQSEASRLRAGGVWEEVSCNLNLGNGGEYVYVWMKKEQPIYICDVNATKSYDYDQQLLSEGFTRVDVNTNMGTAGGAEVFIWYRKTTDFSKSLSDLFISTDYQEETEAKQGNFEKVDVNLNENTGGGAVFLWSKKEETGMKSVRSMVLLLNMDAVATYQSCGVKVIKRNLNKGTSGAKMYLCGVVC